MTRYYYSMILLFCLQMTLTAQFFGGDKRDEGTSFCEMDGSFYITGATRSFGSGGGDIWFVKANEHFQKKIQLEIGSEYTDYAGDITSTYDGNIVLAGSLLEKGTSRTEVFLAKYDSFGSNMWFSSLGNRNNDLVYSIKETSDHGFLITGFRTEGLGSIFVIKTNHDGVLEWEKSFDSGVRDIGQDIIELDDSYFLIANVNSFVGRARSTIVEYYNEKKSQAMVVKIDKGGNELWRKFYGGSEHNFFNKITSDSKGSFYIVGSSKNGTNGSFDMILTKIDSSGTILERENYGGSGFEYGNSIDVGKKGEILLTGTSNSFSNDGTTDILVTLLDTNREVIWEKVYGGDRSDYGTCGKFIGGDKIAVLGSTKSTDNGISDVFFVGLNIDGLIYDTLKYEKNVIDTKVPFISVFPNPAKSYLRLYFDQGFPAKDVEFKLYNDSGELLQKETYESYISNKIFFNELSEGIYVYEILYGGNSFRGKMIIN